MSCYKQQHIIKKFSNWFILYRSNWVCCYRLLAFFYSIFFCMFKKSIKPHQKLHNDNKRLCENSSEPYTAICIINYLKRRATFDWILYIVCRKHRHEIIDYWKPLLSENTSLIIEYWIVQTEISYQAHISKTQSFSQVYYEQLVLHPEEWMRKILKFVDVPWNESVLHHEEFINKPNGVSLSKYVHEFFFFYFSPCE